MTSTNAEPLDVDGRDMPGHDGERVTKRGA